MKKCFSSNPFFQPPRLYKRFIDDILAIFEFKEDGIQFITEFNNIRPGIIKLTHQVSDTDGVFLDVTVFKGEDFASSSILETKLYQKPMNKYVYLHYQSCHCKNLLKNFVQSEIKRYRLTCSRDVDFEEAKLAFRDRLVARSYPINILDEWMNLHYDRNSLFANRLANQKVKRLNKRSTKTCPLIFKIEHTKRTKS